MKKLKLIRKIVNILKFIPESENFSPKTYALQFCQHHKMIDDACQIFQLIIDSPGTTQVEKSNMYEDFSSYCAKWGRF